MKKIGARPDGKDRQYELKVKSKFIIDLDVYNCFGKPTVCYVRVLK